jgi:hypothetical protein
MKYNEKLVILGDIWYIKYRFYWLCMEHLRKYQALAADVIA